MQTCYQDIEYASKKLSHYHGIINTNKVINVNKKIMRTNKTHPIFLKTYLIE